MNAWDVPNSTGRRILSTLRVAKRLSNLDLGCHRTQLFQQPLQCAPLEHLSPQFFSLQPWQHFILSAQIRQTNRGGYNFADGEHYRDEKKKGDADATRISYKFHGNSRGRSCCQLGAPADR
jgi:hypothetical protein